MTNHSEVHNLINSSQLRVCQSIIKVIYSAFDRGEYALGVFLDLSNALDFLALKILLNKLEYYGFGNISLKWFESSVSQRKQ